MKKTVRDEKLSRLTRIYTLFDTVTNPFAVACTKKCAACCTCNVTATGLEARLILDALSPEEAGQLSGRITGQVPRKRYQPGLTTNMFARYIIEGRPVPDEENEPSWGRCPLLVEEECSIYTVRPLGCRAMMSTNACEGNGYAQMPPLVLTINTIFQQAMEHLDQGGVHGNLWDVLDYFLVCEDKQPGMAMEKSPVPASRLLKNEKIPVLMVPDEHRTKLSSLVQSLSGLIQ